MSQYVWYVGPGRSYTITGPMWAEKGVTGVGDVSWSEDNSWSVDQSKLTSPQLALLGAMTDFSLGHSDVQPKPGRPAGGAAEADYNGAARKLYEQTKAIADKLADPAQALANRAAMGVPARPVQIADNCMARGRSGVTVTAVGTYAFEHKIGVAASSIQFGYGNWLTNYPTAPTKDVDPATSPTISVGIVDQSGNVYQMSFRGDKFKTIGPGSFVQTDLFPIDLQPGDVIYELVFLQSGTAIANRGTGLSSIGGFTATNDLTITGSAAVGTTFTPNGFGAMSVTGVPSGAGKPKSVLTIGDSIGMGIGDGTFVGFDFGYVPQVAANLYYCGGGWPQRALSGVAGMILAAQQGDALNYFVTNAGRFRRWSLAKLCCWLLSEYGRNDLTGGQTAAQIESNLLLQSKRAINEGMYGTIATTVPPRTTSTDNFATVNNQTVANTGEDAQRVLYNTWVRAGCPIVNGSAVAPGTDGAVLAGTTGHPIVGYVDVAATVESGLNSGKWKAAERVVNDATIASGSGTINFASSTFTNADKGKDVTIVGAGASGTALTGGVIMAVNSSTQIVITNQAGTAVTNGQMIVGPYTADGLHPTLLSHTRIASDVQPKLLSLMA